MSRFDNLNRFSVNPVSLHMKRSKFKRDSSHKTTFKAGYLIPIYCDEVLPGDTFNVDMASVVRSITPVAPVMDSAFVDFQWYFVPNRLCVLHEHDWEKIMGENFNTAWAPTSESSLVSTGNAIKISEFAADMPSGGNKIFVPGSTGNYFGIPTLAYNTDVVKDEYINIMPFIGFAKIWNDWFRDENTQNPITNFLSFCKHVSNSDDLLKVNKYKDYFTSALPAPQKGDSVLLPLGDTAKVVAGDEHFTTGSATALKLRTTNDATQISGNIVSQTGNAAYKTTDVQSVVAFATPSNLWADLTSATAISVNDLRYAFAFQRLEEKDARGGTRYDEMLLSHFGVSNSMARLQRPEFLHGESIPLSINTVVQTSETNTTPLGDTGAMSITTYGGKQFVKSFTEFGYLYCVACVRSSQSYSQGLPKMFSRNRRYSFYDPTFANIGEQPIFKKELYLKGMSSTYPSDSVFGYQEAWAEYRYKPNLITGELAPDSGNTILSHWTYTNNFIAMPVLNSNFIYQPSSQFDDTFVIDNSSYHFIADFYFDIDTSRVMPLFSIPGLIDHH